MTPFHTAQADDPFDPAPMLIHADWLEEQGDAIGAAVLRGLAESGTPSLHALALETTLRPAPWEPDGFSYGYGSGDGYSRGASGDGCGIGDRIVYGYGSGGADGIVAGSGGGSGSGDADGILSGGGGADGYRDDLDE